MNMHTLTHTKKKITGVLIFLAFLLGGLGIQAE